MLSAVSPLASSPSAPGYQTGAVLLTKIRLCSRHSPYGGQLLPDRLLYGAAKFL